MFKFLKTFLKEKTDPQELLRARFEAFRRLLAANNQILALLAEMEDEPTPERLQDDAYLYGCLEELGEKTATMIAALNQLSDNAYPQLLPVFQRLREQLQQLVEKGPIIPDTPYILPLHALTREKTPAVGGKMANLGEIRNRLGLPVPRGFAITAAAYQAFMSHRGLEAALTDKLAALPEGDLEALERVSQEIQELLLATPLPPDLEEILLLTAQALPTDRLAVRSSAVGEDSELSFAGQFTTLLNVTVEDLPAQYKQIIASKFSPQALHYWRQQGLKISDLPMAVGVLGMIPAVASGVMFTADPEESEPRTLIINAIWGLGKYAVDGKVNPDIYRVDKQTRQLLEQRLAYKPVALYPAPGGGCVEQTLPPEQAAAPCLTPGQLETLAEIGLALEQHFGAPQDVEWALDPQGAIIILQSRPLRMETTATVTTAIKPGVTPLLQGGVRAVGGVGAGPVYLLTPESRLEEIPSGAVVVAHQPSIRLVLVLDRIRAIITEVGSPTDHLTILAREYRVPTIVGLAEARAVLTQGQVVTVDADHTCIYAGVQATLLTRQALPPLDWATQIRMDKYRRILRLLIPLNLLDPRSPDFRPENCRTLHDLTRFCHEKAMDAMFVLDGALAVNRAKRLLADLPFNLYVLDLGGGTSGRDDQVLHPEEIRSWPLLALLKGYQHPDLATFTHTTPDLRGFISVFANTMYDAGKADAELGGRSFAIVSEYYLHFSSRLGYHFALVDAYLSPEINDNYISVQFKGGAASIDRRERRVRLLQLALQELGFQVQVAQDLVQARIVKYPEANLAAILQQVAILLAFCRQLDVVLVSDAAVDQYLEAFRRQEYRPSSPPC